MENAFTENTTTFKTSDGLTVTADIYGAKSNEAPVILLFHQARYSRGEYRPIAPKLTKLGFTCVAIDQRSGKEVNGVENETYKEAVALGKGTAYSDALPDLEAALSYVTAHYPSRKIILWGSSYSASLVLIMAKEKNDVVSAVVAFSPGEYFEYKNRKIKDFAKEIRCPVFIASARNEYDEWKEIYGSIPGTKKYYLPEVEGAHGSKALWEANTGSEKYWESLEKFLTKDE